MAAIPPPPTGGITAAPPPPTGGGTTTTTTTTNPTTYLQRYQQQQQQINDQYDNFLAPFAPTSGRSHESLTRRTLSSGHSVPKAYLGLVEFGGTLSSVLIHRLTEFISHPVQVSSWDGMILGFGGDVLPGNHIELTQLPPNAFEVAGEQRVATIAHTHALLAAEPTTTKLGPFNDGDPDTELVKTRRMVPVPPAYVPMVLDRPLDPKQLWEQVGGTIIADGQEAECGVLLDWLRVALTWRAPAPPSTTARPPVNLLGSLATTFPPLRVDAALQSRRWEILRQDLPALDPSTIQPADHLLNLVDNLRAEQAATRLEQAEARNRATAPKQPTTVFPQAAVLWKRYCLVATDDDLPPIYHTWANSTKAERRITLQAAFDERVESGLGVARVSPLATKELYELLFQGKLGSHPHEGDDLSKGLSPFMCGFQVGTRDTAIQVRAQNFDQMLLGHMTPSLAEQQQLSTKDIPIPTTIYELATQLACTSTVLDVALGESHPLATTIRQFMMVDWPNMEATLHTMMEDPTIILPLLLRWLQRHMVVYFRGVSTGRPLSLPRLEQLVEIVEFQSFHLLPPMPQRYVSANAEETPAPEQSNRRGMGPSGSNNRDPGERVTNTNPINQFVSAYSESGRRIADLRGAAPQTTDRSTGQAVEICLSYHLRGSCYANCQRASTHRNLSTAERRLMSTFVAQHLPATTAANNQSTNAQTSTTTSAAPTGAESGGSTGH